MTGSEWVKNRKHFLEEYQKEKGIKEILDGEDFSAWCKQKGYVIDHQPGVKPQ